MAVFGDSRPIGASCPTRAVKRQQAEGFLEKNYWRKTIEPENGQSMFGSDCLASEECGKYGAESSPEWRSDIKDTGQLRGKWLT